MLLSGGSGSRLWPLSNNTRSKQFLKVLRGSNNEPASMVQRVFKQINDAPFEKDVTIATVESQTLPLDQQIQSEYSVVIEPERRDTAPAVMLACAHLFFEQKAKPEDVVVVMPIDTYADQDYYNKIENLAETVESGLANLVLLGVEPTYPSTKYGYIVPEARDSNTVAKPVKRFSEKPSEETAQSLIAEGALWNCGVFAFQLQYLLDIISEYINASSYDEMRAHYSELPKNSFDYEVVEKAESIAVVPYKGVWKDLGTWNTLTEEMRDPFAGRVVAEESSCSNSHIINETGLPLVVAGIENAVVVATHDGILVASKDRSAHLKPLVEQASEDRPMYEKRKWGEYRVLDYAVMPNGSKALTKELILLPGKQLSYQRHERRSETWTIICGNGEFVLDDAVQSVGPGSVLCIPAGAKHALKATEELHLIEVQLGASVDENDITREGTFWPEG